MIENIIVRMAEYYRERAAEYETFYGLPAHANDLSLLHRWLPDQVHGRQVLEIAAGTGYWTRIVAPVAACITATDISHETLALAEQHCCEGQVSYLVADAFELPAFTTAFDAVMAHHWWSHLPRQLHIDFLHGLASRLAPGSTVLMIDQSYVAGFSEPESNRDNFGNRYEMRTLIDGRRYEIIKNYPDDEELKAAVGRVCSEVEVTRLRYFWALKAVLADG
jgi:SAM-dependent methyltransferase